MHVHAESSTANERATLRLTRGISRHTAWLLSNDCGSSLITIGAGPSSDWQILAPGMAGYAMSIGFVDGVLCACSGPHSRVTVNGRPLPEIWEKISGPVVLALGTAELALTCDDARAAAPRMPERGHMTWPDTPAWDRAAHGLRPDVSASAEHARRAPHMDLPSLLGRDAEPRSQAGSLQRVAFATLTGISYLAWLYLLDHL